MIRPIPDKVNDSRKGDPAGGLFFRRPFVYPGLSAILTPVSAEVVFCSDMGYNTVIIYAMEVTGWNRTKQQPGWQFRWYWYC